MPIASWISAKYFVPFYRNTNSISAYSFLEERFGYWARAYASTCYLLTQIARIGSVLYLMALPMHTMLGWSVPVVIILAGFCVIIYSVLGGIKAVIWNDAIQGIILIVGAISCSLILLFSMLEEPSQLFRIANEYTNFLGCIDIWNIYKPPELRHRSELCTAI